MATLNAARALEWEQAIGSIRPGKDADLIAIPLTKRNADPVEDILEGDAEVQMTMIKGEIVYKRD